jgi:uncharacterized oligopeptide transporter (OPT) family protein
MSDSTADSPAVSAAPLRPPGARELTWRALVVSAIVAVVIAGSYPYIVMKLGFGPNISVVSAFFGYLALGLVFRDFNRWENNLVQTAGTAAGQTAFLCVLLAAFDMLKIMDPAIPLVSPTPVQSFLWLSTAGLLGTLLAVPMRRHYVVEEKLTFADGVAAAETLVVLDSRGSGAKAAARSMGVGTVLSALVMLVREDARLLAKPWLVESLALGPHGAAMAFGISWSLLSLGSGMLVGLRINLSMMIGTLISWYFAPDILMNHGLIEGLSRKKVLLWVMWPATGMLVAGGLTALFMRWKILAKTFKHLSAGAADSDEFPMSWVIGGSVICSIALVAVQWFCLGIPPWMTVVAILLSLPLMLVSLRVLGETNWGPISALSNLMQAVFGMIVPHNVPANMVASGVTGSIVAESEGIMQDYKTGELIGSTPKYLTWVQLMAVPIGALTVSYVYPMLRDTYGIATGAATDKANALASPISQKWAGFAQLLSKGFSALPPGAVYALAVAGVLGILFTILEGTKLKKWTPSPTGIGIGMLVPGSAIFTMFLGSVVDVAWGKLHKKSHETYLTPLASGFIAGEAIIAVLIPILVAIGILTLQA